jgi:muramidase (phage lysozyme)
MFTIICNNDKIWNQLELIDYLVKNQDKTVELDINPEATCLTNLGVYQLLDLFSFKQVNIYTWNPLEYHPKYQIKLVDTNYVLKKTIQIPTQLQTWDQTKIFFCFYGRPTAGRLGLAGHLFKKYNQ